MQPSTTGQLFKVDYPGYNLLKYCGEDSIMQAGGKVGVAKWRRQKAKNGNRSDAIPMSFSRIGY